jgi:hypothetical protein
MSILSHRCDMNVTDATREKGRNSELMPVLVGFDHDLLGNNLESRSPSRTEPAYYNVWHEGCCYIQRVRILISNTHKRPQLARSLIE